MKQTAASVGNSVNGLDLDALQGVVEAIQKDPSEAQVEFRVSTAWTGQTTSESSVDSYTIGGRRVDRHFKLRVDEPLELLGTNSAPNPQEMLMTALNACIMVGYVAGAATRGIRLDSVEIETTGKLDLRGFLGLDENIVPGYEKISYVVRIKGDGTPEQFREIHANVMKTSPNYFNVSRPIQIDSKLEL